MRLRRFLTLLVLVGVVGAAAAGCATPREQSPAENTEDRDYDGIRDESARDATNTSENITGPSPLYDEDGSGLGP